MAVKPATSSKSAQGIIKITNFADIDDADTFEGQSDPKAYWCTNNTDNTLVSVAESSGTYTFTVASAGSDKDVTLFVIA